MCPTCRHLAVIDNNSPQTSPIVKSIIENLPIRCKNQFDRDEAIREQNQNGTTGSSLQIKYACVESCEWTGLLGEYNAHIESACPLVMVHCQGEGCTNRHLRGYMRSGYCQNSECVVISARSVLEKKKRLDARMKWKWPSKPMTLCRTINSATQTQATEENTIQYIADAASPSMSPSNNDKENTNANYSPKLGSPQVRASDYKQDSPHVQKQSPFQPKPTNHLSTPPTRVYVQADSWYLSASPSSESKRKSRTSGLSDIKIIPTDWGVIRDPIVNSVKIVTGLSCQEPSYIESKDSLTQVDSFGSSQTGTLDDNLEDSTNYTKELHTTKSNKIIVVPNQRPKNNDAFIFAAVKVLVDKELAKLQSSLETEKSKQFEDQQNQNVRAVREMFVNQYIIDFCRSWIKSKPDALHDFIVYRPKVQRDRRINKIMCGLPGPKRTDWEGGLYPVLLEWSDVDLPPICKFPKDFHHANVCPTSGAVMLSTFSSFEWHPEITIPEVLFDLQQLLAHPNHKDPLFDDDNYQFKTRIQKSMYAPRSLLNIALEIEGFDDPNSWQLVQGEALTCGDRREHNFSNFNSRPKEPEVDRNFSSTRQRVMCKSKCSCCVYGQSLWDENREMRFLFGTGMFLP